MFKKLSKEEEAKRHKEYFEKFFDESFNLSSSAVASAVSEGAGMNARLAEFMASFRELIEDEAVKVVDAMSVAFDGKTGKLRELKAATETVSAEVAFMKQSLNTVNAKVEEVERLTSAMRGLTASLAEFKALIDDGTLDRAARASAAINKS